MGEPIKEIYEKFIKISSEKVIEEWAKYKSEQWYNNGIISIELRDFLNDRFSVNPKKYSWKPGFYEHYRLFKPIITNYKRRYIDGIKKKSRTKGYYNKIQKILLIECEKCKNKKGLERHHIIPYSLGGDESPDNIVVLCKKCHNKKTLLFYKNERKKQKVNKRDY